MDVPRYCTNTVSEQLTVPPGPVAVNVHFSDCCKFWKCELSCPMQGTLICTLSPGQLSEHAVPFELQ